MIEAQQTADSAVSSRDIVLSPGQMKGYEIIMRRLEAGARHTIIVGFAGTGKTTLVRAILGAIGPSRPVILTAYSGKAVVRMVEVLADLIRPPEVRGDADEDEEEVPRPGNVQPNAMTLHSLCYRTKRDVWTCPACSSSFSEPSGAAEEDSTGVSCPTCHAALDVAGVTGQRPSIRPGFGDPDCSATVEPNAIVIIDEASMVGSKIRQDVDRAFRALPDVQFLILADSGQIPPVGDSPGYNLSEADVTLTEIHRAEATNPIIRLASELRRPRTQRPWDIVPPSPSDPRYVVSPPGVVARDVAGWYADRYRRGEDVTLLTFSNDTRMLLNRAVRTACGVPLHGGAALCKGEALLVLQNHHGLGLMNGEVLRVHDVQPYPTAHEVLNIPPDAALRVLVSSSAQPEPRWVAVFSDLFDKKNLDGVFAQRKRALDKWFAGLLRGQRGEHARAALRAQVEPHLPLPDNLIYATYGYCLTVHKAQGSEWAHIGIAWDSSMSWCYGKPDGHKLVYTALTRARSTTTIFRMESR